MNKLQKTSKKWYVESSFPESLSSSNNTSNQNHNAKNMVVQSALTSASQGDRDHDVVRRGRINVHPFLGLMYFGFLLVMLIFLMVITYCWFRVFYNVEYSMPRTFAWELTTLLLGSFCNDCIIEHSKFGYVAGASGAASVNQYNFVVTLPWIPLVGSAISAFAILIVAVMWLYRLIEQRMKLRSFAWKWALILLCMVETLHFGFGLASWKHYATASDYLRKYMHFTMNISSEPFLHITYFRWDTTQASRKCCGIDSAADWRFPINTAIGDTRFPLSCCDTDIYGHEGPCRFFPNRYEIWRDGCFLKEARTVEEYREDFFWLLAASLMTILMLTIQVWLLENFLCHWPLFPHDSVAILRTYLLPSASTKNHQDQRNNGNNGSEIQKAKFDSTADEASMVGKVNTNSDFGGAGDYHSIGPSLICINENTGEEKEKRDASSISTMDMKPIFTRKFHTSESISEVATLGKDVKGKETCV